MSEAAEAAAIDRLPKGPYAVTVYLERADSYLTADELAARAGWGPKTAAKWADLLVTLGDADKRSRVSTRPGPSPTEYGLIGGDGGGE